MGKKTENKDNKQKKKRNIFRIMGAELRHIRFPERKKLVRTTATVVAASIAGGAFFSAFNGAVSYAVAMFL